MSVQCPIECVRSACPDVDFVEKNGAWLLTVIGLITGCLGMMFTYFLKSRCKKIKCLGLSCDRDVVALDPSQIEIATSSNTET